MQQLFTFIRKEFLHVTRDRRTLLVLFGLPIAQILIFGFALTTEVKNSRIVVIDEARDLASSQIIHRIDASAYFDVTKVVYDMRTAEHLFQQGNVRAILVLPPDLYSSILHLRNAQVNILADGSDPNTATTITTYMTALIRDQQAALLSQVGISPPINVQVRMLYNPQLLGAPSFVPGVMALVLLLVCVMMTSISIVREKELGTIEVLLVSPFKPILVIVAKVVPYLLLSLINFTTILTLSVFVLGLPINGSIALLYGEATLFICTSLSLGILISTIAKTQQAAMLLSMMGMLLPTMLFSGFMFPIENMPLPLQIVSNVVPSKWFYIVVKSIMIKGLGIGAVWKETLILIATTLVILAISIKKFKVRLS